MQVLNSIENAEPRRRDSMLSSDVLRALLSLDKELSIKWLYTYVSSPVSNTWGYFLSKLHPDWNTLRDWMLKDKIHGLVALDALDSMCRANNIPKHVCTIMMLQEIKELVTPYHNPRIADVIESLETYLNPRPLSKRQRQALLILLNRKIDHVVVRGRCTHSRWVHLIYATSYEYCLATVDWKVTQDDTIELLQTLPILQSKSKDFQQNLVIRVIDVGGDNITYVVLPGEQMEQLVLVLPKFFIVSTGKIKISDVIAATL